MSILCFFRDHAQQTNFFNGEVVEPHNEYTYDALYRLIKTKGREHIGQTGSTVPDLTDSFRVGLPHPQDGQAMRRYEQEYGYDEAGAFLEIVHIANSGSWTKNYSYNEPSMIEPGKNSNRLSSVTSGSMSSNYTYDQHGNTTSMPHLSSMVWDFKDQLIAVDLGGGGNAYYSYDGEGQRVRKVWQKAPGVVEERMYLGDLEIFRRMDGAGNVILERETLNIKSIVDKSKPEPVEEISENEQDNVLGAFERFWENADIWRFLKQKNVPANENEQKDDNRLNMFRYRIGAVSTAGYIFDHQDQTYPDRLAMVETRTVGDDGSAGQMICFQYSNHLGSAALELDETAQILSYEEYYPYGMSSYQAVNSDREITGKRYRFSSKERDEESGLYYFVRRYYDPEIGVFTSSDPILQYWNVYSYTGGNPVNFIDPTGMAAVTSSAADDEAAFILSQSQEGLDLAAWAEGVDADINYSTLLDMHNLVADANATYQNAQAMNAFNNLMFGNDISREMGVVINLANMGANFFPPAKLVTIPLAYSHMAIEQAIRHRQGLGVDGTGLAVNFTLTTMSTVSGFGFGMAGKTGAVLSTGYDATLWGVNEISNSVRNSPPTRR